MVASTMMRSVLCLLAALCCSQALVLSPVPAAASVSRVSTISAFGSSKKAAPKKAVKKSSKQSSSTKGKGGIFPWITNEPGTYAEVAMLSSFDFTGDDGDKWIGWGFMPNSVKSLYKGKTRK